MKRLLYIFAFLFVSFAAMAEGYTSGTKIYFDPGCWNVDGAQFVVYMWNNSSSGWANINIDKEDSSIFSFECPGNGETWTKAIFLRKSNSVLDWSGEYNRIGDISLPNSFLNQISVTGWSNTSYSWSIYTEPTWTLVGEPAILFGETWTPDKTENDLVYENGIWTKTYSKVVLTKGTISFKVCKNHAWDEAYPGSNKTYDIEKDGIYNVTFTFSVKDKSVSVKAEEVVEPTIAITNEGVAYIEDSFSVGIDSNIDNPDVSYFVKIPDAKDYSKMNSADYKFDCVGTYRFKVEFIYEEDVISAEKDIEVKYSTFVAGTSNLCGSEWSSSDENNAMEEVDGVFSKIYTDLSAGEYEFKVVYKGIWLGYDKVDGSNSSDCVDKGGNIKFTLEGQATVTISYDKSTDKIVLKVVYANFPVGEKFYFSSDKGVSRYAAYLFGASGEKWVDISLEYNNIYSFFMPDGEWDGLIYCAMKQGTTENNWDNRESQTDNLRYEDKNWYVWGDNSYWRNFENLIFAGQKLYFKPDSNWEADGARFAAYYWDVLGENRWADCVYNDDENVYEVIAPIEKNDVFETIWTNIKFVRFDSEQVDNSWDYDKHRTENLVFDGVNDLFIISLKGDKNDDEYLNSADPQNWVSLSTCFRDYIFFKPNPVEMAVGNRFSVYFWNPFGQNCWVKFKPLTGYTDVYYVVVPEGFWTGANICSMNPNTDNDSWDKEGDVYIDLLNQTDNLTYHSDKLLYQTPDTWNFKGPADEYWSDLEEEIDFDPENAIEINGGMENGAYYQAKKYTMSISGSDVNKWNWISLPYDVNVADIKSNITTENPYGIDFIMKRYDTATRAAWEEEQAPVDDQTWIQLTKDDVLEAGRGYILGVNNSLTGGVTLTFPANSYFHIVSNQVDGKNDNVEAIAPELNVNSNWHLIGTGLYAEAQSSGGVNFVAYPDKSGSDYTYYYLGSVVEHEYFEPTQIAVSKLEKYKAFFVQYGGEYSFSKEAVVRNMAPRRARTEEVVEQYYINIKGEKERSRTAIFLADDGSNDYVVGKDFLHFGVTGKTTQLYTKQNARLLSFNYLKKEDCVVELGGYVVNAGEYTISLTDNGASSIVLIDNYTGESVDLTFEDYTFTTEKGSLDGRFTLAISYIEKDVTTEIGTENVGNILVLNYNDLVVVEGLTIGNHVWIYDAVGRCVSSFVAEEERYVLNVKEGAYVLKTSMESVKFVVW